MTRSTVARAAIGPNPAVTLAALFGSRVAAHLDRLAVEFVRDDGEIAERLTFHELDDRARALAAVLHREGFAGERVLLLYPPCLDFVVGFLACAYAGVIAVPAPPPRMNRPMVRVSGIIADCRPIAALTTRAIADRMRGAAFQPEDLAGLCWLSLDDADAAAGAHFVPVSPSPTHLALLQYTSGSTGQPKGSMVSHGNLLANISMFIEVFGLSEGDRGVSWLPFYHDMGLIGGVLVPLLASFPMTFLAPQTFSRRPSEWLRLISDRRATYSIAPNGAFDLCVDRVKADMLPTLDLTSWRVAVNGAEPIRLASLDRFAATFAPAGFDPRAFCPGYGLAENTLMVSATRRWTEDQAAESRPRTLAVNEQDLRSGLVTRTEAGLGVALVSSGPTPNGVVVRIVDPRTTVPTPEGGIGEIWVAGASVAQGYWNRPNDDAFHARLSDEADGLAFLRTGDLGFMHKGQLFVTGRRKDVIIVQGENHYPHDLEWSATRAHGGLEGLGGAAFTLEIPEGERLILIHELDRHLRLAERGAVMHAVRARIAEDHGLALHAVCLIQEGSLPRTTSGKVRRHAARDQYVRGTLKLLSQWSSEGLAVGDMPTGSGVAEGDAALGAAGAAGIGAWLRGRLAAIAQLSPDQVDLDLPLATYGMDSRAALGLAVDLEQRLGVPVSPIVFYDHPSARLVSSHLADLVAGITGKQPDADTVFKAKALDEGVAPVDAVAIVGMACRFPGADDLDAFWRLLRDGGNAIAAVPVDRWPASPGAGGASVGGFLSAIDQFDPVFFGITPREAAFMDPQQRLVLEVAWSALESAGIAPDTLAGSATGVWVGACTNDYARLRADLPEMRALYAATGNSHAVAANRVSYLLDLRGPSLAVDTACSSSLLAVHLACASLRQGESTLALVGGVNVLLDPENSAAMAQGGSLSVSGACRTFDAAADGYVRSEGCGMVVLKPLAAAQRDGNPIWAVIAGSAVNQDGRSNGLTAPNGSAQEAVVRQALRNAGVGPAQIGYVETHGTGTPLGDPIEVVALRRVLGPDSLADSSVWLGSVKANIGHLEAAAGVAGLIKAALVLSREEIPPQVTFERANPALELEGSGLAIPTTRVPWRAGQAPRFAGVSGFGFGGSNVHVILGEAPPASAPARARGLVDRRWHALLLSGPDPARVQLQARHLATWLDRDPDASLADLTAMVHRSRSRQGVRLGVVADSLAGLRESLAAMRAAATASSAAVGTKAAWVFSGQGTHAPGMGARIYAGQPAFRAAIDRCAAALGTRLGRPLPELLFDSTVDTPSREPPSLAQPLLFALEYGLAMLWRSWGIVPAVVVGHSLGEYVAATVAGAYEPEQGIELALSRGALIEELALPGQMALLFAPAERVTELLSDADVVIAAYNGPENTVISGTAVGIGAVMAAAEQAGVAGRILRIGFSSHSPLVEPMLEAFGARVAAIPARPLRIPLISNATGSLLPIGTVLDAEYWREHTRQPVRFAAATARLREAAVSCIIEVGPHSGLPAIVRRCWPEYGGTLIPSLRAGQDEWRVLLEGAATAWTAGQPIERGALDAGWTRCPVSVPTTPYLRQRCWIEAPPRPRMGILPARQAAPSVSVGWLARPVPSPDGETVFAYGLKDPGLAFLADHRFGETPAMPAAGFLAFALTGMVWVYGHQGALRDIHFQTPLLLDSHAPDELRLVVGRSIDGSTGFRVESGSPVGWTIHVVGRMEARNDEIHVGDSLERARRQCTDTTMTPMGYYAALASRGLAFGTNFQRLASIERGENQAIGRLESGPASAMPAIFLLPPPLLDACFQLVGPALPDDYFFPGEAVFHVPESLDEIRLLGTARDLAWASTRAKVIDGLRPGAVVVDTVAYDDVGCPQIRVNGLRMVLVGRLAPERRSAGSATTGVAGMASPLPPPAPPGLSAPSVVHRGTELTVESRVATCVADLLGLGDAELVGDRSLLELGLDSMLAAELALHLEESFGRSVPVALILAGAGVRDLALVLTSEEDTSESARPAEPFADTVAAALGGDRGANEEVAALEAMLASIDQFSDEEVTAMLGG